MSSKSRHKWFKRSADGTNSLFESDDVKVIDVDALASLLKNSFEIGEGQLDLLVGGPPCQGYSGIGHRRSYSVEKEHLPSNHLYQDMANIIRRLQPRAFLFENVRGLLNAKWNEKGDRIWPDVLRTFKEIEGYSVAYELVYAKEYGVPQNRPRVLLVGLRDNAIREDVKAKYLRDGDDDDARNRGYLPQPTGKAPPDLVELLGDLLDPKYKPGEVKETTGYPHAANPNSKIQKYFRKGALKKGDAVKDHVYSNHSKKVLDKFEALRHLKKGEKLGPEHATKKFAQRVLPRTWGEEGPTITATSLPDDYVHYKQNRTLTVREWARLQMFPDWYKFEGKRTTGGIRRAGNPREGIFEREVPKYTQIGNAVPVGLAKAVGDHLKKLLAR